MTRQKDKIGNFQLYTLFFVCRGLGLFTFIAPEKNTVAASDYIFMFLPFILSEALVALPVFCVIKKHKTLPALAEKIHPVSAKILSVLYGIGLVLSACVSLTRFELFMSTVLYPDADLTFFVLLLLSAALMLAFAGIETIGRASFIVFWFTLLSILAVSGATMDYFDVLNFTPVNFSSVSPFFVSVLSAVSRTTELITLLFLSPEIPVPKYKNYLTWVTVFGISAGAVLGLIAGVTGEYGNQQMFRLYTLTEIAEFGIFERLDALLAGVWVLCSLFRTAFYLHTANRCITLGFQKPKTRLPMPVCAALTFFIYLFLSQSTKTFSDFLQSGVSEFLFMLGAVVCPAALILLERIKNKRVIDFEKT